MKQTKLVLWSTLAVGLAMAIGLALMPGCQTGVNPVPGGSDAGGDTTPKTGTGTGKYVGASRCLLCHKNVHDTWSQTAHAGAFDLLVSIGQSETQSCLQCHTVGYGDGGFVDNTTTWALAGVQCESCHGAGYDHVNNVGDKKLRPPHSVSSAVCKNCHTGSHHPTYDEWSASGHAAVVADEAAAFAKGTNFTSCGPCHSGDYRQQVYIDGNTVTDTFLQGVPVDQMNAQTCAICHDPHAVTNNDIGKEPGHDFQLRYAQVTYPTPSNDSKVTTDPTRFNICGQCHHSRGSNWTSGSRPSHHSIQANMYVGEMDASDNVTPLVPNQSSIHSYVPGQCSTCHMYSEDAPNDTTPAVSGHSFAINLKACYGVAGCHLSEADVTAKKAGLQTEIQNALASIRTRMGGDNTTAWEYTANDNTTNQKTIPDAIKKVRWLYYWVLNDGSLGVHNPEYARSIINTSDDLLKSIGK